MPTHLGPPQESMNSYYLTIKSSLVLGPDAIKELMAHGLFDSDPFLWIKCEQSIEKVIKDIVVALTNLC